VAGELDPARAEAVRQALAERGEGRREAELVASNQEILQAYPPERMAEQIRKRAAKDRSTRQRRWQLAVAGSVASVMAVVMVRLITLAPWDEPTERTKGGAMAPQLSIWRKTASEPERLRSGAVAKAGDVLQIAYASAGARYGVIMSLDGRGKVTVHL